MSRVGPHSPWRDQTSSTRSVGSSRLGSAAFRRRLARARGRPGRGRVGVPATSPTATRARGSGVGPGRRPRPIGPARRGISRVFRRLRDRIVPEQEFGGRDLRLVFLPRPIARIVCCHGNPPIEFDFPPCGSLSGAIVSPRDPESTRGPGCRDASAQETAIDFEDVAGDVAGQRRAQEQDRVGHSPRRTERPRGMTFSIWTGRRPRPRTIGVSITPGATALTRMAAAAIRGASTRVKDWTPALAAA